MGFWIYMTCMACLISITMIGFGRYFMHTAPKNINIIFGYRTWRSIKNEATWKFAHKYCGKIWFINGIITLVISIIAMIAVFGKSDNSVGYVGAVCALLPIIMIIVSVVLTEKALKKNFDEFGQRK